jgi:hypothetical protein
MEAEGDSGVLADSKEAETAEEATAEGVAGEAAEHSE